MAFVGAETLAIVREPGADDGVLCYREEQVTFTVELDLGERTLVTREENGPLLCVKSAKQDRKGACKSMLKQSQSCCADGANVGYAVEMLRTMIGSLRSVKRWWRRSKVEKYRQC